MFTVKPPRVDSPLLNSWMLRIDTKVFQLDSKLAKLKLSELTDVNAVVGGPATDQVLQWNGTVWLPGTVSGGGGGSGDITEVVAGNGLTGGATSGSATLNVVGGTGITVTANAISIDTSVVLSNIVEDTSPQLGGTLDANSNTIDMGTNTITDAKVGNWDTAHGWGNHASGGYLTSQTSHTDVVVDGDFGSNGIMTRTGAGSYAMLTDSSSNWNTAYGWGNHASGGYQAALTFGIADTNAVKIDSASVADDEYARFTANGLESRSTSEVLSDIGGQASLTFGIANTNAVKIDDADAADDDYAKLTASGIEGRSYAEVKTDLSLDNVENTALSTWAGTTNITTLGAATATSLTVGDNTDATTILGRAKIASPASDIAYFSHYDFMDNNSFALAQTSAGLTALNAHTGQTINLNINDSLHAQIFSSGLYFATGKYIQFEGGTSNANYTNLTVTDPTAARTITLPDATGTVALTSDLSSYQAALTFGIADTNAVKVDDADAADDDYAKLTASGIEGRSYAEVISDIGAIDTAGTGLTKLSSTLSVNASQTQITALGTIGTGTWQGTAVADSYISSASTWNAKQAALTFGIADTNAVKINDADAADDDYAKLTASGIEGRSYSEVKTDLSLDNVENTALSTGTALNATHVLVTDNESTDEENLITFVEGATSATGNVGLEMDGNLTYNPSSGNLTATQLTGTLQTAAQANITSVGTLTGLTTSGDVSVTGDLTLTSTDAGAADDPSLILYRNSASPADYDDLGEIIFRGRNDNSQDVDYARIWVEPYDVSDGTEGGRLRFDSMVSGTQQNIFASGWGFVYFEQNINLNDGKYIVFEGATDDAHETKLTVIDPTQDNTLSLPDATGTVALTSDISGYAPLAGATFTGDVTFTGDNYNVLWDKSDDALEFADNAKLIFGTGNDTSITHDTNHTLVNHTGSGNLKLQHGGNDQLVIKNNGVEIDETLTTRGLIVTQQAKGISAFNYRYIRVTNWVWGGGGNSSNTYITNLSFNTAADGTGTEYPSSDMTAEDAPSPYVASGVGQYDSTYAPWKAFDSSSGSGWWNLSSPLSSDYLQIDLGSSFNTNLNRIDFSFYTSNQAYVPIGWTVYGSANGNFSGEQVVIGTVSDFDNTSANTYTLRSDQGAVFTFQMEGATDDSNETTLAVVDPTADRTITLPDATGTVLTSGNADVGATTTSSGDADHVLVDDGGVLKKITPANLGIGGGGGGGIGVNKAIAMAMFFG